MGFPTEEEETQMLTGLLNGDLFISRLSDQQKDNLLIKLLKERKDISDQIS